MEPGQHNFNFQILPRGVRCKIALFYRFICAEPRLKTMKGFWAVSILLKAFFNYVECSIATKGHFFQETIDDIGEESSKHGATELFLKEEFFRCDGEKACSNVAKNSSSGYQTVNTNEESAMAKENWKKISPVPLGKLDIMNFNFHL